ncbi:hypothetical protein LCGC14_1100140 [marine sediment metagenome]|uniref:Uncharacterized protein n=1 Tax=marine sediment metagenome TaxID=412755 RepID=A0A0F9PSV7_9ZZZZ
MNFTVVPPPEIETRFIYSFLKLIQFIYHLNLKSFKINLFDKSNLQSF